MELKIYSTATPTEKYYDDMAENLNLLAEALTNAQPETNLSLSIPHHKAAREATQFLKSLLLKSLL